MALDLGLFREPTRMSFSENLTIACNWSILTGSTNVNRPTWMQKWIPASPGICMLLLFAEALPHPALVPMLIFHRILRICDLLLGEMAAWSDSRSPHSLVLLPSLLISPLGGYARNRSVELRTNCGERALAVVRTYICTLHSLTLLFSDFPPSNAVRVLVSPFFLTYMTR